MPYEPLHHKYRPQTFAELVGQEAIATTLTNALRQRRIAPAYLFTGARGTGKTSSARILAKSLNCLDSEGPTAAPCGKCEVCRAIANGSALDVIEIDAASNTGVDNIRELIERSQFAPVQCRRKVYVIDECLTGDSQILTSEGLIRIDNPEIQGKQVLSYNDQTGAWEFKRVLRWFDQGVRPTYLIQTTNREIRCTGNHLIRTDQGWKPAAELQPGMKILSPSPMQDYRLSGQSWSHSDLNAPVAVERDYKSLRSLTKPASSTSNAIGRSTLQSKTITKSSVSPKNWQNWKTVDPVALVDAASNSKFRTTCSRDRNQQLLPVLEATGSGTLTSKVTASGQLALTTSSTTSNPCLQKPWVLSTAPYWATAPSPTPTATAASLACPGLTASSSKLGWNTKLSGWQDYVPSLEQQPIEATGSSQPAVAQLATHNSQKPFKSSNLQAIENKSLRNGSNSSLAKDWLGGTWTTDHLLSPHKVVLKSSSIQKATQPTKIDSLRSGLQKSAIQPTLEATPDPVAAKSTTTWQWEQIPAASGSQTYSSTLSPQWNTSLEEVESVRLVGAEAVYDIEVEDNHNFVANGLCVHNCHMLSTAAFNALLKTLEEPPDRVVFVLATTDPQRVLPTIISRCQRFDFRRIPLEAMVQHLSAIAQQESINIALDAVQLVAQIAQGGLRDAESLLDQLSLLDGQITIERVWDLVGAVPERDLMTLLEAIATNDPSKVLDGARHLMNRGREPLIVLQNLASFYRDLLIAKTAPERGDLVAITPPTWAKLCAFAQQLPVALIVEGQKYLRAAEAQLRNTTQPRLWLEVTLLGLLPSELGVAQPAIQQVAPSVALPPVQVATFAPPLGTPIPTVAATPAIASGFAGKLRQVFSDAATQKQLSISAADLGVLAEAIAQALTHDSAFRQELVAALATAPSSSEAIASSPPVTASVEVTAIHAAVALPSTNQIPEPPEVLELTPLHSESLVEPSVGLVEPPTSIEEPIAVNGNEQPAPLVESTPAPAPAQNLDELWRHILGLIEPRSTQALLGQQCRLVSFQGKQACISVKAQPLFKMAQARLPNVEAAFEQVVGSAVKVSLVVAAETPETTAPSGEPAQAIAAPLPSHHADPAPPPVRTPPVVQQPSQPLPPSVQTAPSITPRPTPVPASSAPPPAAPLIEPAGVEPSLPQVMSWRDEDEVDRAAKRFAEFFGGKVVDLEGNYSSDGGEVTAVMATGTLEEVDAETDEVPF